MAPLVATEKPRIAQVKGWRENLNDDDHAVLALRNFIFDICNQNGGGHGGSAIGMAAIGVALYKYTMRYNPSKPEWFDRDRFVLSNGMPYGSSVWQCAVLTWRSCRSCRNVLVCAEPSRRL
jgi:dihydroxyacetone synthase